MAEACRVPRWLAAPVLALIAAAPLAAQPLPVIPAPRLVQTPDAPGLRVAPVMTIALPEGGGAPPGGAADAARWLAGLPRPRVHLAAAAPGRAGAASIRLIRASGLGSEGYTLDIGARGVTIAASGRGGWIAGAATLWQLLEARSGDALAAVHIEDSPRLPWRGLLLDSARHMQSPASIRRLIDVMALHKLNTLQWHLADDQGWRLQIRRYPRLTAIGAWRKDPGGRYGGFYTQAEARGIVAYAAARNVTVVPEIEMPGHAFAAIRAYPQVGYAGVGAGAQGDWGIFPSIYKPDPPTLKFLENVLDEVIAVFPSKTIAIGGDEAQNGLWHKAPDVQARIGALGIAGEPALQGWFIQQIAAHLARHGRRAIGWDDILAAGALPGDAMVLSWHNAATATAALKAGHDVVMASDPTLYFDHRQAATPGEPTGRGTVISLEDVYRFNLAAPETGGNGRIVGIQGELWSEYVADGPAMLAMAWPRAAALAEVGWSTPGTADWAGFAARLPAERSRLARMGVGLTPGAVAQLSGVPAAAPALPNDRVSQQLRTCSDRIALNLPGAGSGGAPAPALLVDIMDRCWIDPAVPLDDATRITVGIAALPFNYQLGDDLRTVALPSPRGKDDELVIHRDDCKGPELARVSLKGVPRDRTVARLTISVPQQAGTHDLCLFTASHAPAPLWALDRVMVEKRPERGQ